MSRASSPSAVGRLVRSSRRQRQPVVSQRELAEQISTETDISASRDQIARLETSKPLEFVPDLLAAATRVLRIPVRRVGYALVKDFVAVLRTIHRNPPE